MTRKDYELIAETLRTAKPLSDASGEVHAFWGRTCDMFAITLSETNPRFDRMRFLKACGTETRSH